MLFFEFAIVAVAAEDAAVELEALVVAVVISFSF
jgi:hypothetical protein